VTLRGSDGSNGIANGTRIGGLGGATPGATDTTLIVGRDLILTGGAVENSGAAVGPGNQGTVAPTHNITISAARDVVLNGGNGAGARIGSSADFAAPATGDVKVTAGRDIRFNGAAREAAVRTASNVELGAGGTINQNFNGPRSAPISSRRRLALISA
jgi:hypothetical protein